MRPAEPFGRRSAVSDPIPGSVTVKTASVPSVLLRALTVPPCSSTDVADDRQAESDAAVLTGDRLVRLPESLEHLRQEI